jgi:hypothetical protein
MTTAKTRDDTQLDNFQSRVPYQRVYLPLGILTGPGWKNFSGVIIPSFLKTMPFFITN